MINQIQLCVGPAFGWVVFSKLDNARLLQAQAYFFLIPFIVITVYSYVPLCFPQLVCPQVVSTPETT